LCTREHADIGMLDYHVSKKGFVQFSCALGTVIGMEVSSQFNVAAARATSSPVAAA
jgi:hypothetical protein